MSGFAGVLNLDDAPVDTELLHRMMNAISYRGPHDQKIWVDNQIGMVHTLLNTTSISVDSPQLLATDYGIVIASSLRLDNKIQLARELGINKSNSTHSISNAELVINAYQRWGYDCVNHIKGDFSFALWDKRDRKLFCVRDPLGIKQLFYCFNQQRFVFSTDISAILKVLDEVPSLNMPLISDFLRADYDYSYDQTIYRGILKLKPAHWLIVSEKNINDHAYFDPASITPLRYRNDGEYVEHFHGLFKAAVSSRLPSDIPIGIQVSGGVDSSAITSMGKHLVDNGDVAIGSPVKMYSTVASKRFPLACESQYLDVLTTFCPDWPVTRLDYDKMWALKEDDKDIEYNPDEPDIGLLRRPSLDLFRTVRSDGIHVLLNGVGGDQVLHGDGYHMSGMVNYFPLLKRFGEARNFSKYTEEGNLEVLYYRLTKPWLSLHLPTRIKSLIKRLGKETKEPSPWVLLDRNEFNKRNDSPISRNGTHADVIWNVIYGGHFQRALSSYDYLGALHFIENSYPFLDIELVKFLSSVPINLLMRNGTSKWILRENMRNIMPEELRTRTSYAIGDELIEFGLQEKETKKIQQLLKDSASCQFGWVDCLKLQNGWQSYWKGDTREQSSLGAWINLEKWLAIHKISLEKPD